MYENVVAIETVDSEHHFRLLGKGIIRHIEHARVAPSLDLRQGTAPGSCIPRPGNDAIQPFEKSASKLLNRNERNFGACGLQDFDAKQGERRRAGRERNGPLNRLRVQVSTSTGSRKLPRKHAGLRGKMG